MMPIRIDLYTKVALTAIVLLLGAVAIPPLLNPVPVRAQNEWPNFYVEPGLTRIPDANTIGGETLGKLVINLRTGETWGFPMVTTAYREPVVSKPVFNGTF